MSHLEIQDPQSDVAKLVVDQWVQRNNARQAVLQRWEETRRYVSAPDTNSTEVGRLPWKNRTTIPKLTQITDNLVSAYMAALMPADDWFRWEGMDAESHRKGQLIEQYMQTKLRMSGFRKFLKRIVQDWVIYGNCFAGVTWVREKTKSLRTGEEITNYVGPKAFRISPYDALMDERATCIDNSAFIYRRFVPITDLLEHNDSVVGPLYDEKALEQITKVRTSVQMFEDFVKWFTDAGLEIDGFSSWEQYLRGQQVEILEYHGDLYNPNTKEILKNRIITVADRAFTLRDTENPAWNGKKPFVHSPWRILPDNAYGQGPLDNLVGMQYRVDHLENCKADAYDQIIHPIVVVKGDSTEEYKWAPGETWYVPVDGDVTVLRPDASVLAANNEIALYHSYMELFAGSPREMMGFRTPGEKTAFEISVLQQGADRQFVDKTLYFEENFIEPLLNIFYEMLVRNMDITDVARTFNDDTRALEITTFSKEDVVADGILRPVGAKHFAARTKRVQELQNFLMLTQQAGTVQPHISGLRFAKAMEEELGFEKYGLVQENVAIDEQMKAQVRAMQLQQVIGMAQEGGGGEP